MSTYTLTYSRTHTSVFVADNMRNLLRDIITWSGLDQTELVDHWNGVIGEAIRTWLHSGHLYQITLEFFVHGTEKAMARWDFPISYDGSGVDDDMWVAKDFVRRTIEKSLRPPRHASYRVVLFTRDGYPHVAGMVSTTPRSTDGLIGRLSGTAIATPDIMASLTYWRAA